MAKKKLTLDDIFESDDFGLLESRETSNTVKTNEDRLIESFEEINSFIDKNNREPNTSSMSEYGLMAKLKNFRENEAQKQILKPYDKHNLLGHVEIEEPTLDDILEGDELGLLESDKDLDIFKFKHTPKPEDRAEADFVAQRKPIKEKDFLKYEEMFQKVHKEIKEGKRKILPFKDVEKHLKKDRFYIADGVMLYLENVIFKRENESLSQNTVRRKDGRTRTIFENGTYSNMLYRSLAKIIYSNGKMISEPDNEIEQELFINSGLVEEEDVQSGWLYILKLKSTQNQELASINNLYKIGFSSKPVDDRIKNAQNEATYLFSEVKKVATYQVYNRNALKLEQLLHRFFANACLNIDLYNEIGQRMNPREWFVVPFEIIDEAVQLIFNENIVHYEYDPTEQKIKLKANI